MKLFPRILLLALWTLPFTLCADSMDVLNQKIKAIQEKYSIVGLSVVGVKNGAVAGHIHSGLADIDRKIPVTEKTKFRIASISKLATTTALMQLWEQGKFKLDADISDYLGYRVVNPRFPKKKITFRHLLTHTSSLIEGDNYDQFLQLCYEEPRRAPNISAILTEGGAHFNNGASFSEHAPGTSYSYSNLGYGLLGTLVEKLSGERFNVYCQKHILDPLEMKASFTVWTLPEIETLAVLYGRDGDGWKPGTDNHKGVQPADRVGPGYPAGHNALVFGPQGGLRVSALDLSKFMLQLMPSSGNDGQRVLKKSTIKMMLKEHWKNGKKGAEYRARGLGFHLTHDVVDGELWAGHSGSAYGLLSDLYFQKDGSKGVILITNGSRPGKEVREFAEMEREIIDAVLDFFDEANPKK